jgi:HEAT repeat protein
MSQLARQLTHRDWQKRQAAAEALGRADTAEADVVPALILALTDVHEAVRRAATDALAKIEPDWATSPQAQPAVPGLILALGGRSSEAAQHASAVLSRLGATVVPALAAALADEDKDTRQVAAARTLGRIGPEAAGAVHALTQALRSEHTHVRQAAAEALARFGPSAEPAVPTLAEKLNDWSPAVRQAAAEAVGQVGSAADVAVPALIQLLSDREESAREAAMTALARIGPAAAPLLLRLLTDPEHDQRRLAERLQWEAETLTWLGNLDPDAVRREPRKALGNLSWYFQHARADWTDAVRQGAATVLGRLGPAARDAVPVLTQGLTDPDAGFRRAAALALGQLGPLAADALSALVRALADASTPVRKVAAEALPRVEPAWTEQPQVRAVAPFLVEKLKGRGDPAKQVEAEALVAMGVAAVPALVTALGDDDRALREAAAELLGRIGPPAREAVPALRRALQDAHSWVRDATARALQQIDPTAATA